MKKIFAFFLTIVLISCGNDSDSAGGASDSTGQTEIGGVENVNGNIPDTTATGGTPTSGNNTKAIDSSYADTTNKKP
ncbi:MAG TPA: hypothetical protein VM935_02325 [Chitinophagaceae bacterium]|jgi:hypothetical protein|nr:hypothetical protein [Chitinophagaceae bacterium]